MNIEQGNQYPSLREWSFSAANALYITNERLFLGPLPMLVPVHLCGSGLPKPSSASRMLLRSQITALWDSKRVKFTVSHILGLYTGGVWSLNSIPEPQA